VIVVFIETSILVDKIISDYPDSLGERYLLPVFLASIEDWEGIVNPNSSLIAYPSICN